MPTGWIADRLSSARADAERIARELAERGLLTPGERSAIVAAVDAAIERGAALVTDALRQPQRIVDELRSTVPRSGASDSTDVATQSDAAARLAAVEARLAALEEALLAAGRPPGNAGGGR